MDELQDPYFQNVGRYVPPDPYDFAGEYMNRWQGKTTTLTFSLSPLSESYFLIGKFSYQL